LYVPEPTRAARKQFANIYISLDLRKLRHRSRSHFKANWAAPLLNRPQWSRNRRRPPEWLVLCLLSRARHLGNKVGPYQKLLHRVCRGRPRPCWDLPRAPGPLHQSHLVIRTISRCRTPFLQRHMHPLLYADKGISNLLAVYIDTRKLLCCAL